MLPAIKAGDLRDRVRLWQPTDVVNEFNETTESFLPAAEVWASVEPLSGRELEQAQAIRADVQTRVTIRFLVGIDNSWRIGIKDKQQVEHVLDVVWIKDVENRHVILECYCAGVGVQRAAAPGA